MFYSSLLFTAAALSGLASAQNYSTSGNLTVVPDSVEYTTRQAWCRAQLNSCPMICGGVASSNTCDADDLTYSCVCSSGTTPNISSFAQTIPYYECQQWIIDCTAANPNDLDAQTACQSVTCGSRNASAAASSSSSVASSSSSAAASSTSGGAAAATTAASGSASKTAASTASASATAKSAAMSLAREYGTGALIAGLVAVFGFAL